MTAPQNVTIATLATVAVLRGVLSTPQHCSGSWKNNYIIEVLKLLSYERNQQYVVQEVIWYGLLLLLLYNV